LDHLIDRVATRSFALEGGDEFPPVSGMGIEEFLDLCKIGTLVRGQLRDFILTHR
jgi:hypothetical protein